jgi:two-component sensor histidine kinase
MVKLAFGRWRALWHAGLPSRSGFSLVFALACVAVATIVRIGLGAISPASAVFAPYYSATLVAALVGGAAAGGCAAIAGAVAAFWLFVPPDWTSHAFDIEQVVNYVLFAASSLVIIWAANSYRELLLQLREAQERRQLLNYELAHRIKNTLAIVQAVIGQTLSDQPAALDRLNARIAALAATNDLLIDSEWRGASVHQILAGEFAPYDASRFRLDGEDFACPSAVAIMLALVFHELTTNAAKHGALSAAGGTINITWTIRSGRLDLDWIESGGPAPTLSRSAGFGTTLLHKGLQQFDGEVDMDFTPRGLHCKLSLTLPASDQPDAWDVRGQQTAYSPAMPQPSSSP